MSPSGATYDVTKGAGVTINVTSDSAAARLVARLVVIVFWACGSGSSRHPIFRGGCGAWSGWSPWSRSSPATPLTYPTVTALAQLLFIVGGHVLGVIVAHDRAVALLRPEAMRRAQLPLLGVMVVYTVGGLVLLFSP